jgi:two-component system, LytTR family, sensor kinase
MFSWINKHKVRILLNILAWGFLIDATYTNSQSYYPAPGMKAEFTLHVILYNALFILASCLNTMWLMPKYFVRRKYVVYIPALATLILTFSAILSRYNAWMVQHFKGIDEMQFSSISIGLKTESIGWIEYWFSVIPSIVIVMFIFSIGYLTQQYFKIKKQQEAIDKKQLESELSLLKSQINPHFLFNVLNSIYALALKKSDYAPEIVLKLSDIMRYMLYETKHEKVALDKEIDMIENYIEIEKVRIGSHQQIAFAVSGDMHANVIAPVLLIPFVENAVKHGIDSMSENAYVHISVNIGSGELQFNCINNYKEMNAKKIGGIGLENVKKRLELIYPEKHTLIVKNENSIFTVSLNIMLN